jgi:hypothetical protein
MKPFQSKLGEDAVTREEHRNIIGFIDLATNPDSGLERLPLDVEADAIIRALFVRNPEAAYRVTVLAMAQAEELVQVKTDLLDERRSFRGNWLSRLLGKPQSMVRDRCRDPRLQTLTPNRGR